MIPLKKHLVGYNSNTFLQDAVAGLVVGMVTIPQAIAYALLAGVPAQAGLYACLLPMILYALLGSSKHLVVGPVAIAAVMIVSTVSEFVVVCSSVNRIDTSGLAMFSRLSERLKGVNITLNLSDLKGSLEKNLDLKDLENGISGKIFRTAKETMVQLIEETNHR